MDLNSELELCLNCKEKPCSGGCPLNNDIPQMISLLKNGNYEKAYEVISKTTVLPAICGKICPHFKQCQGSCVRKRINKPINIGNIESFLGDLAIEKGYKIPKIKDEDNSDKSIAIVGAGPAGLTCAAFLARYGFDVTIFERHSAPGGILMYGVPEFRLNKDIVKNSIDKIIELGVKIECNKKLGKDITIEYLRKKYNAVFLSFGGNCSSKIGIVGENLEGVFGANELLEFDNKRTYNNKDVVVIGGGNVAMDAARTAIRMGAKSVKVIYRRSEKEMPAEVKEIEDARDDGVEFLTKTNIVKILPDEKGKKVKKIECVKTKLVQKEEVERKIPVNIEGSNYIINTDIVIVSLGSKVDDKLVESLNIETNDDNTIKVDENGETSIQGVFAGGNLIGEKSTVAYASRTGRNAAESIIKKLMRV